MKLGPRSLIPITPSTTEVGVSIWVFILALQGLLKKQYEYQVPTCHLKNRS